VKGAFTVSKVAVLSATYRTAEKQIRQALDLLGYRPRRKKLLIKPNLAATPLFLPIGGIPRAAIVDVRFIKALLRVFDGYEITIAEDSLVPYDTDKVFEKTGVAALAPRPWHTNTTHGPSTWKKQTASRSNGHTAR
jgi:hypothetical protein